METVVVLYDYTYEKKDGTPISIKKDQRFTLVDRTNAAWWRVKPELGAAAENDGLPVKGFYVPAKYVKAAPVGVEAPKRGKDGIPRTNVQDSSKAFAYGMSRPIVTDPYGDENANHKSSPNQEMMSFAEKKKNFETFLGARSATVQRKSPMTRRRENRPENPIAFPLENPVVNVSPPAAAPATVPAAVPAAYPTVVPGAESLHSHGSSSRDSTDSVDGTDRSEGDIGESTAPQRQEDSKPETVDDVFRGEKEGHRPPAFNREKADSIEAPLRQRPPSFVNPLFPSHESEGSDEEEPPPVPAKSEGIVGSIGRQAGFANPLFNGGDGKECEMNGKSDFKPEKLPSPPRPLTRHRPATFNYLGKGGSGGAPDVDLLKHQLRKTRSRENMDQLDSSSSTSKSAENVSCGDSKWRARDTTMKEDPLPPGWTRTRDEHHGHDVLQFQNSDIRWFSGVALTGRVYYYSEDRTRSQWSLPENPIPQPSDGPDDQVAAQRRSGVSEGNSDQRRSGVSDGSYDELGSCGNISDQSSISSDVVLRKGWMHYARLQPVSNSRKPAKKNWAKGFVVLIGDWLVFYVNEKKAKILPNYPFGKPEFKVDLRGGRVEDGAEKTKRSLALLVFGGGVDDEDSAILIHNEDTVAMAAWRRDLERAVAKGIDSVDSGFPSTPSSNSIFFTATSPMESKQFFASKESSASPSEESGFSSRKSIFSRTRKTKRGDSGGGGSGSGGAWLDHFFKRRPSIQYVKEKGIVKGGGVFGANLDALVERETLALHRDLRVPSAPAFVVACIAALENRNCLETDGLYRINGNLAEIQRLRFLVEDAAGYDLMDPRWDVHVLTGSLKLFFRELESPLIPWELFEDAVDILADAGEGKERKASRVKPLFTEKRMSATALVTLQTLCRHLLKVMAVSDANRMQASNIAICFGPTLMWSDAEITASMAFSDLVIYQTKFVEFLLLNFSLIFDNSL